MKNYIVLSTPIAGKVVCVHTDDCLTGMHRACQLLLEEAMPGFKDDYLNAGMPYDIGDVSGVAFGPFVESDPYCPETDDPVTGLSSLSDEVRVSYWWGNSNLYYPFTQAQFDDALKRVSGTIK